jgi:hypothetical protein
VSKYKIHLEERQYGILGRAGHPPVLIAIIDRPWILTLMFILDAAPAYLDGGAKSDSKRSFWRETYMDLVLSFIAFDLSNILLNHNPNQI